MNCMFSICIPVHNGVKYLPLCLQSISNQHFTNWEVVIIDDNSDDGLEEYIPNQNIISIEKLKYVRLKSNVGPHLARKIGYDNSSGEYIFYIDSDDELADSSVLSQLKTLIDTENCDLIIFNMFKSKKTRQACINYNQYFANHTPDATDVLKLFAKTDDFNNIWNKVFHRSLFPTNFVAYEKLKMCEDRLLAFQIIENSNRILIYDRPLYYYRQTPLSTTHSQIDVAISDQIAFVESYINNRFNAYSFQTSDLHKSFLKTWARVCCQIKSLKKNYISLSTNSYFRRVYSIFYFIRPDLAIICFLLFYHYYNVLTFFVKGRQVFRKMINTDKEVF